MSDAAKHTAAEWTARVASYGWDILALDHDPPMWIAACHGPAGTAPSPYYPRKAGCEANARLIAACPTMLEALKKIAAGNFDCAPAQWFMAAQGLAEAAIKRATQP